jgi:hypothetical protein
MLKFALTVFFTYLKIGSYFSGALKITTSGWNLKNAERFMK